MNISLRLLVGYFLIVGLAAWFVMNVFSEEVKPGVSQTMEETLVDTAHLLAEMAAQEVVDGLPNPVNFASAFQRYQARNPDGQIWEFKKDSLDLRVYMTDAYGIVVYDSAGEAVGRDYSRWNDVYLTLRGRYGVRSTRSDPKDSRTTVMYVAAPIEYRGEMIGVLTVAKPILSVQPFIDRSLQRIQRAGWWMMGGALAIGLLFTWWLTHSIGLLRSYARDVSQGKKRRRPELGSGELAELGHALAEMREKLDGREYVENYVHHLVHEMKTPLTTLIGSAELLNEELPEKERAVFAANIHEQSIRLKAMLDKLLLLAKVEHRDSLEDAESIQLRELVDQVIADQALAARQHDVTCNNHVPEEAAITGESFLIRQAIANLLHNAIEFSPPGGLVTLSTENAGEKIHLAVRDQGGGIPDYARERIFERFYSLERPDSRRKSTGLGLPFVREVALLHGGEVVLKNMPQGGVEASLILPVDPLQ